MDYAIVYANSYTVNLWLDYATLCICEVILGEKRQKTVILTMENIDDFYQKIDKIVIFAKAISQKL